MDVGGHQLSQVFPISSIGKIGLPYVSKCLAVFQPSDEEVEQFWRMLIEKLNL
jgi:hypothetical protein